MESSSAGNGTDFRLTFGLKAVSSNELRNASGRPEFRANVGRRADDGVVTNVDKMSERLPEIISLKKSTLWLSPVA